MIILLPHNISRSVIDLFPGGAYVETIPNLLLRLVIFYQIMHTSHPRVIVDCLWISAALHPDSTLYSLELLPNLQAFLRRSFARTPRRSQTSAGSSHERDGEVHIVLNDATSYGAGTEALFSLSPFGMALSGMTFRAVELACFLFAVLLLPRTNAQAVIGGLTDFVDPPVNYRPKFRYW